MARFGRIVFSLFLLLFLFPFLSCGAQASGLRVISLYPGHTDNVIALGGAAMLVGVSQNDEVLPGLPRFSQRTGAEALLALRPDVVLSRELVDRVNPTLSRLLGQAGVRVYSIEPPGWEDFPGYLRRLADILGLDPEPGISRLSGLLADIEARARAAQAAGKKAPRVFIEATSRELHTCAPDSWAARLMALAGGINAAGDARPARSAVAPWGLERVLKLIHEGLDLYLVQSGAMNAASLEDVRARPWLAGVRVAMLPEAWLSRPSLLGLERGGRELLRIFYGEEELP